MSFVPGPSRIPAPRQIHGTRPGLIDSTQPERLLRVPGSTLSFAVFDPLAAAGSSSAHARKRHNPEPTRPKRIVIETPPGGRGTSHWRFVPRARRAPGVEDEGVWPRRIILEGEFVICSEDQWDIYKLDPAYDCFIPNFPGDPVITRKTPEAQQASASSSQSSIKTDGHRKRRPSTPTREEQEGKDAEPPSPEMRKRFRTVVNLVTDEEDSGMESITESDDEDEVEEIVADEFAQGNGRTTGGRRDRRKAQEARRKDQREKMKSNLAGSSFESHRSRTPEIVDLTMEDDTPPNESTSNGVPPSGFPAGTGKRRVYAEGVRPDQPEAFGRHSKKHRTGETISLSMFGVSQTDSPRAEFERKRAQRKWSKMSHSQDRQEHANLMKEQRERRLWEEILADTPRDTPQGSQSSSSADGEPQGDASTHAQQSSTNNEPIDEEEMQRLAAIEESRRKLAELERDRPLWEQEARKRAAEQRAQEEAARIRQAEERQRAKAAADAEQRQRQHAAAEAERRARAERERVEREREQRQRRERERWSYGPWTTVRAIERYKLLSDAFDAAKFTADDPVLFEIVPWPVLHAPATLRVEDIDWAAVEEFFAAARSHMRAQDYKAFVEKSHKRFHPDRWRARGVLKSVADEETRGCLEVAANTVAQALTPIWRDVRG